MTLVCSVVVQGRTVELRVEAAESGWLWSLCTRDGFTLRRGEMTTKAAAQIASQLALEYRLYDEGLTRFMPVDYFWQERLGST